MAAEPLAEARPRHALGLGAGTGLLLVVGFMEVEGLAPGCGPELLLSLLLGLMILPWLACLGRRRFDLFEPPIVLTGVWLVAYVFPSLTILAGVDPLWNLWGPRASGATRSLLSSALSLSTGFFAAFLSGYLLFRTRAEASAQPARFALVPQRFRAWSLVTAATALALFVVFVGQIGGLAVLLSNLHDRVRLFAGLNYLGLPILSLLSVVLLGYARLLLAGERPGLGFLALLAFAFGINTLQGTKTNLLAAAIALVVTRHYLSRPIRVTTVVVFGVGAALAALSFDLFFREYLVNRVIVTLPFGSSPLALAREAWVIFYANALTPTQVLMLMVDGMPLTLPFQVGQPYLAMVTMAVPRALFPEKPPVATEIFSRTFFPELLDHGTSIPASLVGEFYMNFGAPGVLLGGLLAGCGMRWLYGRLQSRRREPTVVPLYGLVIGTLLPWIRGDSFGPTVFVLMVALPLVAIASLSRRRVPPATPGREGGRVVSRRAVEGALRDGRRKGRLDRGLG